MMRKVRIFTDGACSENPGPGGWAVVFNLPTGCKTITGNENPTTNNRMELMAVIKAFKQVLNKVKDGTETQYDIYSDSAYVVNSINNNWVDTWWQNGWVTTKGKSVKNKDLWEHLILLIKQAEQRSICITLNKIKGHAGDSFNELADKLARDESIKAKESTKVVEY